MRLGWYSLTLKQQNSSEPPAKRANRQFCIFCIFCSALSKLGKVGTAIAMQAIIALLLSPQPLTTSQRASSFQQAPPPVTNQQTRQMSMKCVKCEGWLAGWLAGGCRGARGARGGSGAIVGGLLPTPSFLSPPLPPPNKLPPSTISPRPFPLSLPPCPLPSSALSFLTLSSTFQFPSRSPHHSPQFYSHLSEWSTQ